MLYNDPGIFLLFIVSLFRHLPLRFASLTFSFPPTTPTPPMHRYIATMLRLLGVFRSRYTTKQKQQPPPEDFFAKHPPVEAWAHLQEPLSPRAAKERARERCAFFLSLRATNETSGVAIGCGSERVSSFWWEGMEKTLVRSLR